MCVLQPYGVSGTQPPPGLVLEDARDFQYTAYFGDVPASKCGQQWQVRPCWEYGAGHVLVMRLVAAARPHIMTPLQFNSEHAI